jgi:iron complex transport system permease protein
VTVAAALISLAVAMVALAWGDAMIPLGDVVATLFGAGSSRARVVVLDWRLPRVLLALVLGACLAVSGAIFQSLTRNALGSPDIIGFSTGAYTGALITIIVAGGGYVFTAAGSFVGGAITALIVYLLAYRRGVQGFRLIIVGIGVSTALAGINTLLIIRADLDVALRAATWGAGSLAAASYAQLVPVLLISAILLPLSFTLAPTLRQLELGDDAASALGTRTERSRLGLMLVGVGLTALATAAAGPISFVALVAPQIARRITRRSDPSLAASGAVGAVLLLTADVLAQRLFAPSSLPVGVMTVSIGGFYFVWLLMREARKG